MYAVRKPLALVGGSCVYVEGALLFELGAAARDWAVVRRTTLGRLCAPARDGAVFDAWAPLEVARFEAAICLFGKDFGAIARAIGSKSAAQVIEFFYAWKQSKVRAAAAARNAARGAPRAHPPPPLRPLARAPQNYATWKVSYQQSKVGADD